LEELEVYRIHPPKYVLRRDLGSFDELLASIEERSCLSLSSSGLEKIGEYLKDLFMVLSQL